MTQNSPLSIKAESESVALTLISTVSRYPHRGSRQNCPRLQAVSFALAGSSLIVELLRPGNSFAGFVMQSNAYGDEYQIAAVGRAHISVLEATANDVGRTVYAVGPEDFTFTPTIPATEIGKVCRDMDDGRTLIRFENGRLPSLPEAPEGFSRLRKI